MKKLSILSSVLLLLFMVAVSSGCGSSNGDGNGNGNGNGEAKVDCAQTFCIGTLLAESEDFNAAIIEAVNLARDDINSAGGSAAIISGNSFRAGAGEVTASAMQLLEMGVHGVVGPSYSSDSLGVLPFLNENEMPTISPSATSPTITEMNKARADGGDQVFFFRVAPSDLFQAPILASQSTGKTIIVNREDAWGTALAEEAKKAIESDSSRQVRVVSYDPSLTVNTVLISVLADVGMATGEMRGVDSIIILAFEDEGGEIIKAIYNYAQDNYEADQQPMFYVGDGLVFNDKFFEVVDRADVEGFKRISSTAHPDRKEEFEMRFAGGSFSDFSPHAYDAAVILALAALSAGSNDPSDYVSEIRGVTEGGEECSDYATCAGLLTDGTMDNDDIDYNGISGPIDLDENGDITDGLYAVETYNAQGEIGETEYFDFQGMEVTLP